jgi:hypothetical protein
VTIAGPTEARPADGRTVDFVVVPDRAQLREIVRRARDGRLRTNIGTVSTLDDAVAAFNSTKRLSGKTIIRGLERDVHRWVPEYKMTRRFQPSEKKYFRKDGGEDRAKGSGQA